MLAWLPERGAVRAGAVLAVSLVLHAGLLLARAPAADRAPRQSAPEVSEALWFEVAPSFGPPAPPGAMEAAARAPEAPAHQPPKARRAESRRASTEAQAPPRSAPPDAGPAAPEPVKHEPGKQAPADVATAAPEPAPDATGMAVPDGARGKAGAAPGKAIAVAESGGDAARPGASAGAPPAGKPAALRRRGPGRREVAQSYLQVLRARVAAKRRYPYIARRAGIEGKVCVDFEIDDSGRVSKVKSGCGRPDRVLVEAAFAALSAARPLPRPPAVLGARLRVRVPVTFRLR